MKKILILVGLVIFCFVSYGQIIEKITYENKVNLRPIVDRTKQSTAEDWNEVKAKFNSLVDYLDDSVLVITEADPIYSADSSDIKSKLRNLDTIAGDKKVTQGDTLLTLEQYRILANGFSKMIYSITLPTASSVYDRVNLAVEGVDYPTGWVLTSDGVNILITHNLNRWCTDVKVFSKGSGTERQQLRLSAAENGLIDLSANQTKILSLGTILKPIVIYLTFE